MKKNKTRFNYLMTLNKQVFKLIIIVISVLGIASPSNAFIPYVYKPNEKQLKKAGIGIGKSAVRLLQLGHNTEAERFAKLAIMIKPKDDRLWAILAEAQLRANNIEEASRSINKAKRLNPNKSSLWFAEASLALRLNQIDSAAYLINKGLKIDPNNEVAYFQLGNTRIMQSKFKLALKAFEKAVNIKPNFWEAHNNKGISLFELNQIKLAIKTWEEVLKIKPNQAEPMLALAAALNYLKPDNKKSLDLAKQALNKNPNYISAKYQKEQLWGEKLQAASKKLLSKPILNSTVQKALANSDITNDHVE